MWLLNCFFESVINIIWMLFMEMMLGLFNDVEVFMLNYFLEGLVCDIFCVICF